jgi:hypothetical protein
VEVVEDNLNFPRCQPEIVIPSLRGQTTCKYFISDTITLFTFDIHPPYCYEFLFPIDSRTTPENEPTNPKRSRTDSDSSDSSDSSDGESDDEPISSRLRKRINVNN